MLRRVLTVLLALGLIFSLAACSGGDEEGGAEGGGEFTLSTGLDENGFFKGVKAADCVACGQCEGVCPQHLPIIELMKKVSAHFDH